ncbi:LytR/AlgR family response regulator transcription factor [Tunicatimonas pelagia]|uniref:LytR/AlgR family response regulator transcription factor n=1 Tax=Tunicatimonas pelagia TaxID=931531 RepID=UPI002666755A|nr:response regulator [Tunicatimonas pelagia]WKN43082.1 response regulator [Tunicatimonas pelagia]
MEKIKAVIVDDELEARNGVAELLARDQQINVVAICANGIEAIQAIREYHPELLFLDIQMPQVNGFEVLNSIAEEYLPATIFTTAYDEYTLKAFEVHAIDYLLKPFTDERFYAALNHAKQIIEQRSTSNQQVSGFIQSQLKTSQSSQLINTEASASERLTVKVDGKIHFLPFSEIAWIEAYDYYVKIHVKERFYLLRDSLKKMEVSLPNPPFVRIHKSSIVNQNFLQEIAPQPHGNEYQLTLTTSHTLNSSRSYREQIKSLINS